jgi:hypothetical protein
VYDYRAEISYLLQARGDVDGIAINVIVFVCDVAKVHAYAELDAFVPCKPFLHFNSAGYGIGDGGKLHQPAITHALDDFAAIAAYFGGK